MLEKIKNFIIILLSPVSPIVILIIGWLLSILISEPNEHFPAFINFMIDNPVVIFIFVVFWLIFSIVYTELQERIDILKKSLSEKEEIIKSKDTQLNHTAGIVLNRVGDFAKFNRMLRFESVLKGFVDNNTIVESAQIYTYSIKRVKNNVIIKVNYDSGYVYEDIDINNLAQTYYEINYLDYNELKDLINTWKDLMINDSKSFREIDALIKYIADSISRIFKKYHHELQSIDKISDIEIRHFTEYRILTLLLRLARRTNTTTLDKNNILGDAKAPIESFLLNGKRTGILNSILLEDTFMFKYTRNSHKNGRAYVSFHANISNQNYIIVFSIQTEDLDSHINLEQEINGLKADFINRLDKTSIQF